MTILCITKVLMFIFGIGTAVVTAFDGNVIETTSTTRTESQTAVLNDVTAMAMLLSSIQSRLEVSQKGPPAVQDRKTGNNKLKLNLQFSILSVVSVDDMLQMVRTTSFLKLSWVNPALAWNASEHSGIVRLHFPTGSIWAPKLLMINSPSQVDLVETYGKDLLVTSDGLVTSQIPVYLETFCPMDLTHYPFDEQSCPLMFMELSTYVDWEVEEDKDIQQIKNLTGFSTTWTLERTDIKLFTADTVTSSIIVLRIKRKTIFYTVCLVLPMVLTSYMNTMVFLIPPESGEKISFFVSVFVSTSVFISFLTEVMPRGLETIPNVMKLLVGVLAEGLLILLTTIFILRRFHQETSASISKRTQKDDKRIHPLDPASPLKTSVHDGHDVEGKQAEENAKELTAASRSFSKTLYLSARQLDRVGLIVALVSNTSFLLYILLIDSL